MQSTQKTARVAGLLYLLVVITGMFSLLYAPTRLFVQGNSAATAHSILANQSFFRWYVLVEIVSELLFVSVALVLYQLLKKVNPVQAAIMVLLVLIPAPIAFQSVANQVSTLAFVRGAEFLSTLDKPQRDAVAMLLFNADNAGILVWVMFWGLWLLPLGMLVFRSGFLPRFLGIWLIVNGIAYVIISLIRLFSPQYADLASRISLPALLGEVAFTFWLLLVGARVRLANGDQKSTPLGDFSQSRV
jgi:hypothetical protein